MTAALPLYAEVEGGLSSRERDPLSWWHFAVPRLREFLGLFVLKDNPIDEGHLRGPNKGTKTESAAAYVLACMQKRSHLDGLELPQWRGPIEAAQFVLDYKQQLLSVQPAYLRLLGRWPHHARYTGEILSSLRVKPINGSDDESTWSVLHFVSQENKRAGVGFRADIAAFDEPPVIEVLREMRKSAHAGRRGIRLIADTPTIRRQWAPLKEEYGDCPRRRITRVSQERAECRWSLDEVAPWVLSPAEKAKLLREYATDPLHGKDRSAREHGDYMDTTGSCPFHVPTLLEILEQCRDPEIVEWKVSRETSEGGVNEVVRVPVEVWHPPERGASYYLPADPASGTDDGRHDPLGLLCSRVGPGDLQARFNGYVSPYSLGILQAGLCRQYNDGTADIEVNDKWGINVLNGLRDSHYTKLAREQRELSPGKWSQEIGFHNNERTRPQIIGSVQAWVDAWRSGIKYAKCPSRAVIETLLDCILDEKNRIVAAPGLHDEDLILWGQSLRKAVTLSGRHIPDLYEKPRNREQRLILEMQGKLEPDEGSAPDSGEIFWTRR